jgi:hypothetical protein
MYSSENRFSLQGDGMWSTSQLKYDGHAIHMKETKAMWNAICEAQAVCFLSNL